MVMEQRKLLEKKAARPTSARSRPPGTCSTAAASSTTRCSRARSDIATGAPDFSRSGRRAKGTRAEVVGVRACPASRCRSNDQCGHQVARRLHGEGQDRGLPGIKTSLAAVGCAADGGRQELGKDKWNASMPAFTVGLPHPEAYTALMSGKTDIRAFRLAALFDARIARQARAQRRQFHSRRWDDHALTWSCAERFVDANPKTMAAFLADFRRGLRHHREKTNKGRRRISSPA